MLDTLQIHSLSDVINFVDRLDRSKVVLFRGQQRESWPLLPKIARIKKGDCTLQAELQILTEFKKGACSFLQTRPDNDWGWLAIAQHHGLATRVLDWSLNPLVALWFAVNQPPCENSNGILWVYSPSQRSVLDERSQAEHPFELERVKVFFPYQEVPRIQAQAGVFTIHPRVGAEEKFLPFECVHPNTDSLTALIIPPVSFERLKLSLDQCGVHAAALMPDMDGLAQRIIFKHEYS